MNINTQLQEQTENMYNSINSIVVNPILLLILFVTIMVYLFMSSSLGKNGDNDSSTFGDNGKSSNIVVAILIGVFIVLLIINGLQYFFGINIITNIKNIFSQKLDIKVYEDEDEDEPLITDTGIVEEIKPFPQVFNIPGNKYVYEDAKALCKAYGSRLANYNEIEDAYNKGASWCNYGWSENQLALFPTQKSIYEDLQKIKGHENDCGRSGINGGYMSNPLLKFGVNCYGYKPVITTEEQELMNTEPAHPLSMKDILFEKRVDYWKSKINDIIISPFNSNNWSKI